MAAELITDMGEPIELVRQDTMEELTIGRYGVWAEVGGKVTCIDTDEDLERLKAKYGDLPVYDRTEL